MAKYVYFVSRDELFRIDLSRIVFCEADGNYTRVTLVNGNVCILGLNLGKMEKMFASQAKSESAVFARVGKRFIINMNFLLSIHIVRQQLTLSDQCTFSYTLDVSKDALKLLKGIIVANNNLICR